MENEDDDDINEIEMHRIIQAVDREAQDTVTTKSWTMETSRLVISRLVFPKLWSFTCLLPLSGEQAIGASDLCPVAGWGSLEWEFTVKKYKSHRSVPSAIAVEKDAREMRVVVL